MNRTLKNKRIVLGVCGSIAAYKAPLLVREIVKSGGEVDVAATEAAKEFVSPLVLSNLSRNPVIVDMFAPEMQESGAWHIALAHRCDLMIIAPATATTIARLAVGLADNALSALALALPREIPLLIAPAMDADMFEHPATKRNLEILESRGAVIIPPEIGELASGLSGPGRLPEIDTLVDRIAEVLTSGIKTENPETGTMKEDNINTKIKEALEKNYPGLEETVEKDSWNAEFELDLLKKKISGDDQKPLAGKKVLITAGPTYEKIDEVRFIGNFSSGKMGFALAEAAAEAGADVRLVTGPVSLESPCGIKRIDVVSADEMRRAAIEAFEASDIGIMSAAVADFTPKNPAQGKIKKETAGDETVLELTKTRDILGELGKTKKDGQFLVGFALETEDLIENALKKLSKKNCDMIVANRAGADRSGFGGDDNTITILKKDGLRKSYPPASKKLCARAIIAEVIESI